MSPTTGSARNDTIDSRQSSATIITTTPDREMTSPIALSAPEAKSSLTASTSLVARVTRRPTGVRS